MDICQSSGLEGILSDWGYLVQTCSLLTLPEGEEEYMRILEEHGGFAALMYSRLKCYSKGAISRVSAEDYVNAAMAIFIGEQELVKRAQFLLGTICKLDDIVSDRVLCQELRVWKTLLSELLHGKNTDLNSGHVRYLFEKYRLEVEKSFLPERFDQCQTLLEVSAWCFERPFSQDFAAKDALIMKWIWLAFRSLHDMQYSSLTRDVCDNLSLLRKILITQGPQYDKEVLAHAWQRLVKSLDGHATVSYTHLRAHET